MRFFVVLFGVLVGVVVPVRAESAAYDGGVRVDAGVVEMDAWTEPVDAGSVDAGTASEMDAPPPVEMDAATTPDAGEPDAAGEPPPPPPPSMGCAASRGSSPGALLVAGLALVIAAQRR